MPNDRFTPTERKRVPLTGPMAYGAGLIILLWILALAFGEFGWEIVVSGIIALILVYSVARFGEWLGRRLFPSAWEETYIRAKVAPATLEVPDSAPWFRRIRVIAVTGALQPIIVSALLAFFLEGNAMLILAAGLVLALLAVLIPPALWFLQRTALESAGFRW